ncbi:MULTISPECIES: sulfite exporter TauE/SafE family protein [Mycobacterium]|uniref:sulfite exporter TauE/SafE family protein n=1 Tax=Mycobacterium TaxID=1763 RepID=UPI000AEECDE8|nr:MULTISPECIES: sulfite exporter TauE/SafE family protein [Mycobacterium]MDP7728355.1 sulfite exporter TauE/SafE family protein [Mycobacterium sp. TY813]
MTTLETVVLSLAAGLTVATVTAPVGVSGAVFLLPIQFSVLHIPSPAVTPTNLLFNIVSIPGALVRYRVSWHSPLTVRLIAGTVPGVVIGAMVRVLLIPGPRMFRVVAAGVLLPLGIWLIARERSPARPAARHPSSRSISLLALSVGVIGGIYGIGGGSLLSPILIGRGLPVATVAPAALASTLVTSAAGAATYTVLATAHRGFDIAPDWLVGIVAGVGGLIGGYLGAAIAPRVPERALRVTLGLLAVTTAAVYGAQAVT